MADIFEEYVQDSNEKEKTKVLFQNSYEGMTSNCQQLRTVLEDSQFNAESDWNKLVDSVKMIGENYATLRHQFHQEQSNLQGMFRFVKVAGLLQHNQGGFKGEMIDDGKALYVTAIPPWARSTEHHIPMLNLTVNADNQVIPQHYEHPNYVFDAAERFVSNCLQPLNELYSNKASLAETYENALNTEIPIITVCERQS